MKRLVNKEMIMALQNKINVLQGNPTPNHEQAHLGLGAIESVFQGNAFARGAVHELISLSLEDASCTNGFISVILGKLMQKKDCCIWVSNKRKIFPPALKAFGIDPEQIVFIDAWKVKDALWTIEEALKCNALTAVVGEISELSFNDSRRLQLAVEKSKVTGFIHRQQPKSIHAVACISRWHISSVASVLDDGMPGIGFPRWNVELLKIRNGQPGKWVMQWSPKGLEYISEPITEQMIEPETAYKWHA
jgi:protein ImuA